MVNKYVGAGQAVFNLGKKVIQKLSGQGKTTGKEGIRSFKPGKNLTTKRNIQDKITKAVDEGTKKGMKAAGAKPEFLTPDQKTKLRQSMSKQKREKSKELKDYSYKSEEIFKRRQKNKKETENLLKGAMGLTATAGVLQGVNIKLKRDEKKRKAKAKKQDAARVKFDAKKSDLDKSGDLSKYEKRRGMAIAKAMSKRNKKII